MFKQLYIDYVLTNRDFFPAAPFVQVHWSVQISSPRSMLWARSVLIALNAIARYKKGRKGSSGTSLFLCPPIRMCLSVFALWTWLHTAHSWQCTVHSWQCTVHSIQLTQSYCRLIQSQLAQPNCTSTENTASSPSSKQTSIKVSGCRTVLRPEHCLLGKGFLVALVAGWESFLSDNLEIFDTNFEPKFAQIYSEISPVSLEFYNAAKNNTREFSATLISLQQIYWDLGEETQRAHWPPFGPTSVF